MFKGHSLGDADAPPHCGTRFRSLGQWYRRHRALNIQTLLLKKNDRESIQPGVSIDSIMILEYPVQNDYYPHRT
jgi:hypothetical protein